ncbi:MAG: M28 family peptidase [Bacteroidota bacterium]|nr:M28 family peptidase [Bacteroidota bacterium]
MKKFSLFIISLLICYISSGQNKEYAKSIIDSLCSPQMYGRGYACNGDKIASDFISKELIKLNVRPFHKSYFQNFNISVNTFPDTVFLIIDNTTLVPGKDFLVMGNSSSIKGSFEIVRFDKNVFDSPQKMKEFQQRDFKNKVIIVDKQGIEDKDKLKNFDYMMINPFKARGLIFVSDEKMNWSNSDFVSDFFIINVKRDKMPQSVNKVTLNIKNQFLKDYSTRNIIGCIPGKICPDSFIVFTAHYDHLGILGKNTRFPGANDNASGVSLLMDLARYYIADSLRYSVAFIFTSAEELGLIGSKYYTENPEFPLDKIKILINFDLVGTGEDGIKVVNATLYKDEFDKLLKINQSNNYLKVISSRGPAANSDHYYFYKKGVKSFFIYTLGGISEYHSVLDKPETLPLTKYNELFKLTTDFIRQIR